MKRLILAIGLLCLTATAQAGEAEFTHGDPELHARVMDVSVDLRCLVCQGQSLADSNSEFAVDMRDQIKDLMVEDGMSNSEVLNFMMERYGEYVLYKPPLSGKTLLLWFGPILLLLIGVGTLYFNIYMRKKQISDTPLSEEDHLRATEMLRRGDVEDSKEK